MSQIIWYIRGGVALLIVGLYLYAKVQVNKIAKLSKLNEDLVSENEKLDEEAEKHLKYMATIDNLKKKTNSNKHLIEEAEDEGGVKDSFDNAIIELDKLRKLRKERTS